MHVILVFLDKCISKMVLLKDNPLSSTVTRDDFCTFSDPFGSLTGDQCEQSEL